MENLMEEGSSKPEKFKRHLVDTTAGLTEVTPIFAGYEIFLAGMSNEVSINARILAAGMGYGGLGSVLSRGRDYSRRIFGISEKSPERLQAIHDTGYLVAFNLVISPIIYALSGETDPWKIATGTALAMAIGGLNGPAIGYSIDAFRDLAGLEECERKSYPEILRKRSSKVKKGIAALAIATSLGITAQMYKSNEVNLNEPSSSQIQEVKTEKRGLEKVLEN